MTASIGMNLTGVSYFSPELPFLNIVKTNTQWNTSAGNTDLASLNLDSNGWPTAIPGTSTWVGFTVLNRSPTFQYKTGTFVFLYTGGGVTPPVFAFDFDATQTSFTPTSTGGRYTLSTSSPTNGIRVRITSVGSPAATDWVLIYSPDSTSGTGAGTTVGVNGVGTNEALYNSGNIFNPLFLNKMAPFKRFRFVDWHQAFASPATVGSSFDWNQRGLQSHAFWGNDSSITYANGPINDGTVPVEVCCALCNQLNAEAWFCIKVFAPDNYVSQMGALVFLLMIRKTYVELADEPWNFGGGPLAALRFDARTKALLAFPSAATDFISAWDYAAAQTAFIGVTWKAIWGASAATKLVVALNCLAADGNPSTSLTTNGMLAVTATTDGCTSTYFSFSGTVQSHIDAIAIAPYFGYDFATEVATNGTTAAGNNTLHFASTPTFAQPGVTVSDFASIIPAGTTVRSVTGTTVVMSANATGAGVASGATIYFAQHNLTPDMVFTEIMAGGAYPGGGGFATGMIAQAVANAARFVTYCAGLGLIAIGYESGQGLQVINTTDTFLVNLYATVNRDPRMFTAYTTYINGLVSAGFTTFNQLGGISFYAPSGEWGIWETIDEVHTPKADALLQHLLPNRHGTNLIGGF